MTNTTETVTFHVIQNHTFGYINSLQPDTFNILASKPQRGAVYSWMDGIMAVPANGMRDATLSDFADFRVQQYPDKAPYIMPKA